MPPTLKDSSTLPNFPENPERSSDIPSAAQPTGSEKPVALEVPVTVNGARAVEGSEKREPFSETTTTVLVLAGGAVIRLSASVAPGQLLFLTNDKTRKEVVCQVVKSKNYGSVSGYVELEFTEPVLGFWGMRFPGERHTAQHASLSASPSATRTSDSGSGSLAIPPHSVEAKPSLYTDRSPSPANVTSNLADAVEEFKTEIKTDSRPLNKADLMAPAEPSTGGIKFEENRLQAELSALLFAEQKQNDAKSSVSVAPPSKQALGDAAAKVFDMATAEPIATRPAVQSEPSLSLPAEPKNMQVKATSSFDAEEVKIPAWLEPLARNAAISAPATEQESDSAVAAEQTQSSRVPVQAVTQKHGITPAKTATTAPRYASAAPVFGKTLLGETAPLNGPRGGSKATWMAIAAGLVMAAAGGGWYFRDSLSSLVSTRTTPESSTSPASAAPASRRAAPSVNSGMVAAPSATPAATPEPPPIAKHPASTLPEASAPVSSPSQGKVQPAAITERLPKANSNDDIAIVEPEITRPSLGKVRLAKPKMDRSAKVQTNGDIAPTLEDNSDAIPLGDNSLGANFAENASQPAAPAAPVAVGGDVKPARLISSVPPAYPSLAKTQHVQGDVRVDALIDATGRVTTMKIVSGPSLLQEAAKDALRQWKYQAATLDGKPVSMHLTVTIQFRLQ